MLGLTHPIHPVDFAAASHAGSGDGAGADWIIIIGLIMFVATLIAYAVVAKRRNMRPRNNAVRAARLQAEGGAVEEDEAEAQFTFTSKKHGANAPLRIPHAAPPSPMTASDGSQAPAMRAVITDPPRNFEVVPQEFVSTDSILREQSDRRLTGRRALQSLLAQIRDRDILYEKGKKIGSLVHAESLADLAEKLTTTDVCGEAQFVKLPNAHLTVRLVGTKLAVESMRIGTPVCFTEAGLLSGALENVEGGIFDVREIRCVVKGDASCEFRAVKRRSEA